MPTRVIRDGCIESERIDALSLGAEVFYKRLWHVVDDFGRYEYSPVVLLSKAFPRRVREYTEQQIEHWMRECATPIRKDVLPLILVYTIGGKNYLQITDFKQRIRPGTESRWPPPSGEFMYFGGNPPLFADFSGETPRVSATRARSTSHTPTASPSTPPSEENRQGSTCVQTEGGSSTPVQAHLLDISAPVPEASKPNEGWLLFRAAADSIQMLATAPEWIELETVVWPRLVITEQLSAIRGIDLRRAGEYSDPAYVHGAHKYLTKQLWTKPPRPVPKPSSGEGSLKEKGNREFEERMLLMQQRKAIGS